MTNEERIRNWRQGGGSRAARQTVLADELLDDALAELPAPAERRVPREPRGEGVYRLPNDLEIQEARLAIIERRQIRLRAILRRIFVFALAPLLVVLFYVSMIATKLYQGEAIFTVQTSSQSAPSPTAGLFAIGGANSTIGDAFKAREFILSRPMMDYMEKRYGFMSHFASSEMDPLTRFGSPLGLNQDPYKYYLKRVRVAVDVQEGILRLNVQARTPEDAKRFGDAILASAEAHVNRFSDKISEDQISSLTRDVQSAEQQVAEARRSLAVVQARRGELAPEQAATAVYGLISNLELQRAEAQRERDALLNQGLTDSPLLPRLNARVEELNAQVSEQRRRLVSPGGNSLQTTLSEFENASARKQIAQARWESTLNTLQQAYLRILEQRRYFVLIVGMSVGTFPKVRDILPIAAPILLLLALIYAAFFAARRARLASGRMGGFRVPEVVRQWRR
jgi:capsular polysaccharide transport system permease protein